MVITVRLVVNLALGLPNSLKSLLHDQVPGWSSPSPEDWLRPAVCLQDDKDRRRGGFQMSGYMNNPPDWSGDTNALCNSFT